MTFVYVYPTSAALQALSNTSLAPPPPGRPVVDMFAVPHIEVVGHMAKENYY
jgi:hypothetical protein